MPRITNPFARWVRRNKLRQVDVALAMGVGRSLVARWMEEGYMPSGDTAIRMYRFTGGEVSGSFTDGMSFRSTPEYLAAQRLIAERASERPASKRPRKRESNGKKISRGAAKETEVCPSG